DTNASGKSIKAAPARVASAARSRSLARVAGTSKTTGAACTTAARITCTVTFSTLMTAACPCDCGRLSVGRQDTAAHGACPLLCRSRAWDRRRAKELEDQMRQGDRIGAGYGPLVLTLSGA